MSFNSISISISRLPRVTRVVCVKLARRCPLRSIIRPRDVISPTSGPAAVIFSSSAAGIV